MIVCSEDQKVIFIHNMQTEGATPGSYLGFQKIYFYNKMENLF